MKNKLYKSPKAVYISKSKHLLLKLSIGFLLTNRYKYWHLVIHHTIIDENVPETNILGTLWEGCIAETLSTVNGVCQGGVLSPVVFYLYIGIMFTHSKSSGKWCSLGHELMEALGYADNGTILAPTVSSFRALLKIYEDSGEEYGVTYNGLKWYIRYSAAEDILIPPQ